MSIFSVRFIIRSLFVIIVCLAQNADARLWIIGQQKDTIEEYTKKMGRPAGIMAYTSIQKMEGFDAPADQGGGVQDMRYYLQHYPRTPIQLGLYMNGALDDVSAGRYNGNIHQLGQWIKKAKRPVYLRIGYEFDLPDNHYDPQEYIQAYQYIVDHLRSQGVANASYVWHSAAAFDHRDFMLWYPGDDYVDWFAVSFFNPMQAQTADDFAALARKHDKPFMIAESSPAGLYTVRGKKDWYNRYFDFIRKHDIPVVCYINSNWDWYPLFKQMHWGDARVEANAEIKTLWLKETRDK